jgi:hypothetical protein
VRAVTAADVRAAAGQWLGVDRLTIAIAGDAGAVSGELESLRIGDVHVEQDG